MDLGNVLLRSYGMIWLFLMKIGIKTVRYDFKMGVHDAHRGFKIGINTVRYDFKIGSSRHHLWP